MWGIDPTVGAAIVAGAATVVVSVFSVPLGRFFERRQQIEFEIRQRKVPMYQDMVQGLIDGIVTASSGDTAAMEELFKKITPQLMTWASDDVISEWNRFKRESGTKEPIQVMFQFEDVLRAIRKDLGHGSDSLNQGDLLGLFVNDIHEHLDD